MVSINGLPQSLPGSEKTSKARRRPKPHNDVADVSMHKSAVANAVEHSVRAMSEPEIEASQLNYDLPEGKSRKALQQYYTVMNHAQREELAQMLGLDIYI